MHDTTGSHSLPLTRRTFLSRGLTLASLASTTPMFLERSAHAMCRPLGSMVSSQAGVPEDRVLVVVQLGGGNDGLNTVVPYGAPAYYQARPQLAIPEPGRPDGALALDGVDGLGLHPALAPFKELLDDGRASIVQGVGYPNPNRSHFTSMDIWHTGNPHAQGNGWLGRYFDHTCGGTPSADGAIAIGREAPLAMTGDTQKPVTFDSADLFRWMGRDLHGALEAPYDEINQAGASQNDANSQRAFLMRTALDAQGASARIREAVAAPSLVRYPGGALANQLRIVAAMIRHELATRVYYVSLGGFDTHANQAGGHANLLRQVAGALRAFQDDLTRQGNQSRVLTMVFSEFGRRVVQNASGGTDHGTAAPVWFMGDMVRPGILGQHPSLTDLDQGDLRYTVDFRCLYAAVLGQWMGADSDAILGGTWTPAQILNQKFAARPDKSSP